jgi:hypothetical protein
MEQHESIEATEGIEQYESWEGLADEVEVTTGVAECWTCFLDK